VTRYNDGSWWYRFFGGDANYATLTQEQRLAYMLTNPALAKVVYLNCDVFSLGKIERKDGDTDSFIRMLQKPNRFQTMRQWLWSYRFWIMYGNAYLKPNTAIPGNSRAQLYWLDSSRIDWNDVVNENMDKLVLSNATKSELDRLTITYEYRNGQNEQFPLGELLHFHDLTNNTGNWYNGESRIDALKKVLQNNESLLDAKNINLEFVRKFLIGGDYDPTKNLASFANMQDIEKDDIENKLRGSKSVLPIKSKISIERFVENLADLKLDETYTADLLVIADMYGIPKELISVLLEGSTYENQEKALSRHISYSEMPKAQDLIEGLCGHFNLNPDDYHMTWDYLSFMNHDNYKESQVNERNARTLAQLLEAGVNPEDALELLGMDVRINYEGNEARIEPNQEEEGQPNRESRDN